MKIKKHWSILFAANGGEAIPNNGPFLQCKKGNDDDDDDDDDDDFIHIGAWWGCNFDHQYVPVDQYAIRWYTNEKYTNIRILV